MAGKRSPAVYIGIGCASVIAVMLVLGGGCAVWLYNRGQQIEADMADPVTRKTRVLEVLGADALPPGYHAAVAVSVPFVMDLAILGDQAPDADGEVDTFGDYGFLYVKMIRWGQNDEELRDFFEGRTSDASVLRDNGIGITVDEIIARGVFSDDTTEVMYVAQRGDVGFRGRRGSGITSIVRIGCEGDSRERLGIWFGPDPDSEAAIETLDLTGTPADEVALREFLDHFSFC